MFDEDISAFFADGLSVVFGAQSTLANRDMPDDALLGDMQLSTDYAITYAANALVGLKRNDSVTVDGIAYTVRSVTRLDDGAVHRATLSKA